MYIMSLSFSLFPGSNLIQPPPTDILRFPVPAGSTSQVPESRLIRRWTDLEAVMEET